MVDAFTGVRRKRGSQLPNLQDSRLPPQIRTDLDPIGMDFLFIGDRQLSDYESIYWWVSWGSGIYETPLHRQWPLLKGLWWFSHAGTEDHTLSAERNTVSQTLRVKHLVRFWEEPVRYQNEKYVSMSECKHIGNWEEWNTCEVHIIIIGIESSQVVERIDGSNYGSFHFMVWTYGWWFSWIKCLHRHWGGLRPLP